MKINHKVSFTTVCLYLATFLFGFSQNNQIDSLKSIVETKAKDTIMVNTLIELSNALLQNDDVSGFLKYSEQANELSSKIDYKKGKAYALKNIGISYYFSGEYLEVFDYWTKSLETFEAIQDTIGMANMLNNLGGIYLSQGSNAKALDYYLKSLSLAEKIKNPFRITSVLPNIGGVYGDLEEYDKALEYFNQMEQYITILNDPQITTFYLMGIGEVYRKMGNYDMALKFYEEVLPLNNDNDNYSHILTILGQIEYSKGNFDKSKTYLNLAIQTAKQRGQKWEIIQSLLALGNVYQKKNNSKALDVYKEAELLAKETEPNKALRDIYQGLSQTYASNGDYVNAFKNQKLYLAQKDTLFNLETNDKVRGLQFDFDLQKKEDQIGLLEKESEIQQLKSKRQKIILSASIISLILFFLLALSLYKRYNFVKETNLIIEEEKNRSENLLLNILPEETAQELKENGKVKAKKFDSVTVLFTDFKGFTSSSEHLSPEALVKSVDYYFSQFDRIIGKYGLEKIKTIGDAYMCAGGLPFPTKNHAIKMVQAAFEIANFMEESKKSIDKQLTHFEIRIGINTGPVVAGVVGIKKFAYDIWGDTVNVASRMESMSEPGKINISENTYQLIKDVYNCSFRGEYNVKNRGMMKMYFVNSLKVNKS